MKRLHLHIKTNNLVDSAEFLLAQFSAVALSTGVSAWLFNTKPARACSST